MKIQIRERYLKMDIMLQLFCKKPLAGKTVDWESDFNISFCRNSKFPIGSRLAGFSRAPWGDLNAQNVCYRSKEVTRTGAARKSSDATGYHCSPDFCFLIEILLLVNLLHSVFRTFWGRFQLNRAQMHFDNAVDANGNFSEFRPLSNSET